MKKVIKAAIENEKQQKIVDDCWGSFNDSLQKIKKHSR
jgi:hypothetical protein